MITWYNIHGIHGTTFMVQHMAEACENGHDWSTPSAHSASSFVCSIKLPHSSRGRFSDCPCDHLVKEQINKLQSKLDRIKLIVNVSCHFKQHWCSPVPPTQMAYTNNRTIVRLEIRTICGGSPLAAILQQKQTRIFWIQSLHISFLIRVSFVETMTCLSYQRTTFPLRLWPWS